MSKPIELKSTLVAGVVGGILLWLVVQAFDKLENNPIPLDAVTESYIWLVLGFVVGVGVQITQRLTGVS